MKTKISRRKAIGNTVAASVAALSGYAFGSAPVLNPGTAEKPSGNKLPFRISLNTSTLMAYKLPVDQQIGLVAEAGFDGVELWMRDIMAYLDAGGSAATLKAQLQEAKLVLENIIGFSQWCNDDSEERKKAIDQLRTEMVVIADLGGRYIATPVMGINSLDRAKLDDYAQRYAEILTLERETGVVPVLELWGMGALNKVSDCAHIVMATGDPNATMLLDFYHVYRGGNDWDSVYCLNGKKLPVIHMNDYPSSPARELLTDAHRLLPGKGVCQYDQILPQLYEAGFRGGLSVELFNKEYWASMDAPTMLKNSYESTRGVVEKAMADYI